MGGAENAATVYMRGGGEAHLPRAPKAEIAARLARMIGEALDAEEESA